MNYRHVFHAGNFADVVKHVVLIRILTYLHDKPSAFRVIDTHAGAGLYDLTSDEARRGGEWQQGIGRLLGAALSPDVMALLRPYLDIVRAFNVQGFNVQAFNIQAFNSQTIDATSDQPTGSTITAYPGSPLIARALLRPQDRLVACELEPGARRQLIDQLRRDKQARVVDLDGWTALRAFVPPNERRGLVLIDPPFEQPDEFERMLDAFAAAFAKWSTGIYMLWYPVKNSAATRRLGRSVAQAVQGSRAHAGGNDQCLRLEWSTGGRAGLHTAGLLIVNPPWTLEKDLAAIMPPLAAVLGPAGTGRFVLERLAP